MILDMIKSVDYIFDQCAEMIENTAIQLEKDQARELNTNIF